VLGEEIARLRASQDLDPARRAALVADLAHEMLQAIAADDLKARIEAIEMTLRTRKADKRMVTAL
jgi:hypothetical protein